MSNTFEISIVWTVEDIQSLRPNWKIDQCEKFLSDYAKTIRDRSIEEGWSIIDTCLWMEKVGY